MARHACVHLRISWIWHRFGALCAQIHEIPNAPTFCCCRVARCDPYLIVHPNLNPLAGEVILAEEAPVLDPHRATSSNAAGKMESIEHARALLPGRCAPGHHAPPPRGCCDFTKQELLVRKKPARQTPVALEDLTTLFVRLALQAPYRELIV
jgi:hypothetical protein